MIELQTMALQDCIAKKHELAAEIARLQLELKAATELAAKWERTAIEIHDARLAEVERLLAEVERLHIEIRRLVSMTLWQHIVCWWHSVVL